MLKKAQEESSRTTTSPNRTTKASRENARKKNPVKRERKGKRAAGENTDCLKKTPILNTWGDKWGKGQQKLPRTKRNLDLVEKKTPKKETLNRSKKSGEKKKTEHQQGIYR